METRGRGEEEEEEIDEVHVDGFLGVECWMGMDFEKVKFDLVSLEEPRGQWKWLEGLMGEDMREWMPPPLELILCRIFYSKIQVQYI